MKASFLSFLLIVLLGLALVDARRPRFKASPFKWNVCDGAKGAVVESLSVVPSPMVRSPLRYSFQSDPILFIQGYWCERDREWSHSC